MAKRKHKHKPIEDTKQAAVNHPLSLDGPNDNRVGIMHSRQEARIFIGAPLDQVERENLMNGDVPLGMTDLGTTDVSMTFFIKKKPEERDERDES